MEDERGIRRGRRRPGGGRGRSSGPRHWGAGERARRVPWASSLVLAVVVVLGSGFAARAQHASLDTPARLLLLAGPALLLSRHRHPVVTVFGVVASALLYFGAGYPCGPVFATVVVACFSAVVHGHRRAAWGAAGVFWGGLVLITHGLYQWLPSPTEHAAGWGAGWGAETVVAAWIVAVLAISDVVRARREQWAAAAVERAAAEERRRDEERLRMARELHDVLAHSISVINVQAGMGLALLDSDPEQARSALTTIKAASKEALGEVRQVLDSLRTPGEAPRAPAPGLDRLPELAEQAASAGLTVEIRREGAPVRLPPGADLAAFRIVQEALTNVVRHSGSRTATVVLQHPPGLLDLRIDDAGPATGTAAGGSGNGLTGMRERAVALGGSVEAGPRADGGFRVRATFPLKTEETP